MGELKDLTGYGPTLIIYGLGILFLLRITPAVKEVILVFLEKWKEVRLRDSEAKDKHSAALGQLADVLQAVAVQQRQATDTIEILQRYNADTADRLSNIVTDLTEKVGSLTQRMDRFEERHGQPQDSDRTHSAAKGLDRLPSM